MTKAFRAEMSLRAEGFFWHSGFKDNVKIFNTGDTGLHRGKAGEDLFLLVREAWLTVWCADERAGDGYAKSERREDGPGPDEGCGDSLS